MNLGIAIFVATGFLIGIIRYTRRQGASLNFKSLLLPVILHFVFFLMNSAALLALLTGFDVHGADYPGVVIIFCAAWILGTAISGASAGIGVREAEIVALGLYFYDANLAAASIALRVLTVTADAFLWLSGQRRSTRPKYQD